ncbi:MAG: hypothetical protein KGL39_27490 [Patescibacteria group bacterium]|nr:hypothetical protein [Patescibacteria group bacterium]
MERLWNWIGAVIVLTGLAIVVTIIFAPKNVDYYYLSTANSTDKGLGFCA